jgi:glycosyltransferase involved in cell wall biosynthesis
MESLFPHGCPETVVVVPCYNEAQRLDAAAFRRFAGVHADVGLLFVDDGSRDGTAAILDALARDMPANCAAMHLAVNSGKAEAVRQGVLAALDRGCGLVGYWDADLATPLECILLMREVLRRRGDIEIVLGSRQRLLGHAVHRRAVRRALGRAFALCASRVLGAAVLDTQCGAKLFRAAPSARRLFEQPFVGRWLFDVELLARRARLDNLFGGPAWTDVVYELPLESWREVAGSKVRPKDFFRAAVELWSIRRTYFGRRPWCPAPPAGPPAAPPLPATLEDRRKAA